MIRKLSILILVMFFMIFLGCAALNIERTVSMNNEFYSSCMPKIQVNANPGFTYLGEFQDRVSVNYRYSLVDGSFLTTHAYIFVEPDENNYVQKGVGIRIITIQEGYVLPDLYDNVKNPIDSGFTKINGEQYQYCTATSAYLSDPKIVNFITGKGYHFSNLYLVKALGRRVGPGNKTKFEILYFENLSHFDSTNDNYWKANFLSTKQKEFVKEFEKNMQNNVQLMASSQPTVKSELDKFANMEEKLKALKIIYDKGLITEEEYSDKKRQILKESLK